MSMKIDRFEIIDVDMRRSNKVGIKDHSNDEVIVLLNMVNNKETTISIAEKIISVIEEELENGSQS